MHQRILVCIGLMLLPAASRPLYLSKTFGDHTIPIKHVDYDYLQENDSHMMMITRAWEINLILVYILNAQ